MDQPPPLTHRCDLCWETFSAATELAAHVAQESNTLYVIDGENVVVDLD